MNRIIDIETIRQKNVDAGHYWFDPATLRFFRSQFAAIAYVSRDGSRAYFVSSEQFKSSDGIRHPRRYTVRVCNLATGHIATASVFQQYASHNSADTIAQRLAEE